MPYRCSNVRRDACVSAGVALFVVIVRRISAGPQQIEVDMLKALRPACSCVSTSARPALQRDHGNTKPSNDIAFEGDPLIAVDGVLS